MGPREHKGDKLFTLRRVYAISVVGYGGSILKLLRLALEWVSAVEEGGRSQRDWNDQIEGARW